MVNEVFTEPDKEFDVKEAFRARVADANSTAVAIVTKWKAGYEHFWQLGQTHGDRAISKSDLQQVFNHNPAEIGKILARSKSFLKAITSDNPELVGTDVLPDKYLTSPYEMTGLTLGDLKDAWK